MAVDAGLATWLKSASLSTVVAVGGVAWGDRGISATVETAYSDRASAITEGGRHAAFLGGPNVKDRVLVPGRRKDLMGKCVTLNSRRASDLGYEGAGAAALVIGAAENANGTTSLTVVKRLGS